MLSTRCPVPLIFKGVAITKFREGKSYNRPKVILFHHKNVFRVLQSRFYRKRRHQCLPGDPSGSTTTCRFSLASVIIDFLNFVVYSSYTVAQLKLVCLFVILTEDEDGHG